MIRVLKAIIPAVLLAYALASILSTQTILAAVQAMGLEVSAGVRLSTTVQDMMGMIPSYLPLILVAFIIGLPVAAGLSRLLPNQRALLFTLAGFAAVVALHLIMKAALGITGIAATRTLTGLLFQGLAGAVGGYCYCLLSASSPKTKPLS
jgi:hypothetical protein